MAATPGQPNNSEAGASPAPASVVSADPSDVLGKAVKIRNPINGSTWAGIAIAYTDSPTYLLEGLGGARVMLPASWLIVVDDA